jgi:hypothetical protein
MARIRRFVPDYHPREDRMVFVTEDADGVATRLWLTRRLCDRLVPHLVSHVEGTQAASSTPDRLVQSWEQAAALAQLVKSPPVPAPSSGGLVEAVNVRSVKGECILTFAFGAGETRVLDLTLVELRQMLGVLHRLYLAAEWSGEIWPDWVSGETAARPADPDAATRLN